MNVIIIFVDSSYTPKEISTRHIGNLLQSYNLNWKARDEEKVNEYIISFSIQIECIGEDAIVLPYMDVSVNKDIRRVYFTVATMRDYRVDKEDILRFLLLMKLCRGFRDDSAVYKIFEKDINNGNYLTRARVESTNYRQWYGKFCNTHCMSGFGLNPDTFSQPFSIFNIAYMSDAYFTNASLHEIFQSK